MTNNIFEPPRSNVEPQDGFSKVRIRTISAGFLGVLYGFFLWAQLLTLPVEWFKPLMPLLKALAARFSPDFGYNLALAILLFASSIPNTFLISVICVYSIHLTGKMRLTLYLALAFPAMLFLLHWLNVAYRVLVAPSIGFNPETVYAIESADFSPKAILIFLVYVLFLLLVFLLSRMVNSFRSG